MMYKDTLLTLTIVLLVLGLIAFFVFQPFVRGMSGMTLSFHPFLFGGALVSFIYYLIVDDRSEKRYKCEHCDMESKHSEIKSGVCPHCGEKIRSFKKKKPSGAMIDLGI